MKLRLNIGIVQMILGLSVIASAPAAQGSQFKFEQTVPFCELFSSDGPDDKKFTRAILYQASRARPVVDGGDRFLFSPSCNNRDFFAVVRLTRGAAATLTKSTSEYENVERDPNMFEVAVKVKRAISLLPIYGNLGRFRAEFEVSSIKIIRPIRDDKLLPDFSSAAPTIDDALSLEASNTELFLWLRARDWGDTKLSGILVKNAKINVGSQTVDLDRVSSELGHGKASRVHLQSLERTGSSQWVLHGTFVTYEEIRSNSWRFSSYFESSANRSGWELKKLQLDRIE